MFTDSPAATHVMRLIAGVLICVFTGTLPSDVEGAQWERVETALPETSILAITAHPAHPEQMILATPSSLYESWDGGRAWRARWRLPRAARAQCLAIHPTQRSTMLLATSRRLYKTIDGGMHWRRIRLPARVSGLIHLALDWHQPDRLYLLTDAGLFTGSLANESWSALQRVARGSPEPEDASEVDDALEESERSGFSLHAIAADPTDPTDPTTLYLATSHGVQRSVDGGSRWESLTQEALPSPKISHLLAVAHSPARLYAATARGLARYDVPRAQWQAMTPAGLMRRAINDLAVTPTHLWAATDDGLYRLEISDAQFDDPSNRPSARELLSNFTHEPTIAQVREAAIRYAEVEPNKIARWRREAALRALLPTLDVGLDRDRSVDATVDAGAFPKFQLIETEDRDAGFDLSVKWDLGDLIWNGDQTAIDARSKLMVQLREEIVDEVTRTYFERRRLQLALLTTPPQGELAQVEQELRLQELTARLDGLTGGWFSSTGEGVDGAGGQAGHEAQWGRLD